ncbi:MAG: TIGR03086 family metal-binding protein [Actinomycetota bacterium]
MSENSRRYVRALYLLDAVARRVPADAWDSPSCCEGWSAREVAGHASWVIRNTGAATGNMAAPDPQPEAEVAGEDPAATVAAAIADTIAALDQQGALQLVAQTPFGEMPVDSFIGTIWVDALTHAWDIADAAGVDHGIDGPTATAAYETLAPISELLRGPGRFDDPIDVEADEVARYIGFTGRTSVRG